MSVFGVCYVRTLEKIYQRSQCQSLSMNPLMSYNVSAKSSSTVNFWTKRPTLPTVVFECFTSQPSQSLPIVQRIIEPDISRLTHCCAKLMNAFAKIKDSDLSPSKSVTTRPFLHVTPRQTTLSSTKVVQPYDFGLKP